MEGHSRNIFFHSLSGAGVFLDLYHSPYYLWILIICSNVLYLVFRSPVPKVSFFFCLQPAAGLTNRVPVRDSRDGTPLGIDLYSDNYTKKKKTGFRKFRS